jgi:hypothetical protein
LGKVQAACQRADPGKSRLLRHLLPREKARSANNDGESATTKARSLLRVFFGLIQEGPEILIPVCRQKGSFGFMIATPVGAVREPPLQCG